MLVRKADRQLMMGNSASLNTHSAALSPPTNRYYHVQVQDQLWLAEFARCSFSLGESLFNYLSTVN